MQTFEAALPPHLFDLDSASIYAQSGERLMNSVGRQSQHFAQANGARLREHLEAGSALFQALMRLSPMEMTKAMFEYGVDAAQRSVLMADALRERGNNDIAHREAGQPPVLIYDHEVVMDGRDLPRPCNYQLLRILPKDGAPVLPFKRPYLIIDPRAGHGAGIGGFKADSQVGVALADGHPVYFVVFRPEPEPGQTLADVMRAEAAFVREIIKRHPEAPKPIIVGNCQGGWATLVLAAANPDITGPLVINGAPVSAWSGRIGENPMRYKGGLAGGIVPALMMADLGGGIFDGAHLVSNFETLNPSRNFFGKYYDLYANIDEGKDNFLEFERWWGGFHLMNEAEIRWIVENIFIGNRLARGEARIEPGKALDLKAIRSPIIVFASHGDNITPPQQALNWILDTYVDDKEIKLRGQRILYMVHEKVGHLGIFVSSSVAKKEHAQMASTLKTIEALAPGLYEMVIEKDSGDGHFAVSFVERTLNDIRKLDDDSEHNEPEFAAVARFSELGADLYDLTVRPWLKATITPQVAKAMRDLHPARTQRLAFSDQNPFMLPLAHLARQTAEDRRAAGEDNPLRRAERWLSDTLQLTLDMGRDARDAHSEATFLALWGTPYMRWAGRDHAYLRHKRSLDELRHLPEIETILRHADQGGLAEGVIRMLILLAQTRTSVRRDRLERSAQVLSTDAPFAALGPDKRAAIIREQSVIVEFEPELAIATLPNLLPDEKTREDATSVVEYILGTSAEMEPPTMALLQRLRAVLGLAALPVTEVGADPLAEAGQADASPAPAVPKPKPRVGKPARAE